MDTSLNRLRDLVRQPREDLETEVKCWLDLADNDGRADLAQAILALANHGGGYILIGFCEVDGSYAEAPDRRPLLGYSQDVVNGIVDRFAMPRFHCDVRVIGDDAGQQFPVVVVPGGHGVPIRAARGGPDNRHVQQHAYYIRRHGPRSEPPQTADEWDQLIRRCLRNSREEMLDSIRAVMAGSPLAAEDLPGSVLDRWTSESADSWKKLLDDEGFPQDHAARFPMGSFTVAYELVGELRAVTLAELNQAIRQAEGHETGWPEWIVSGHGVLPPSPAGPDVIQACTATLDRGDPSDCDFWRVNSAGLAYLSRGYQEDGWARDFAPNSSLDAAIPVWRIGEALLHSSRLAERLINGPAQARIRVAWTGLKGRQLVRVGNVMFGLPREPARVGSVVSEAQYPMEAVSDTLPELVAQIVAPLHAVFGFYQAHPDVIQKELDQLRHRVS